MNSADFGTNFGGDGGEDEVDDCKIYRRVGYTQSQLEHSCPNFKEFVMCE